MTPFDLKEVRVGKEVVHARPIAWDREDFDGFGNDKNGDQMQPVRFHTTCPACAQLIEFVRLDLFSGVDGSKDNLVCASCKAGVERAPDKVAVIAKITESKSPFVDPVSGAMMSMTLIDEKRSQPFKVDE